MELRELDLNLLLVFREIFRARQISAAARHLRLTQSAVSNALARLRLSTGDELFVRTGEGMQPTPFAQGMAEPVNAALAQLEQALRPPPAFAPSASRRRFTLAMSDAGEMHFMPRLIALCAALAPQVEIATVRLGAVHLRSELEEGRVDLALGAFDDAPEAWFQRRLFQQPVVTLFRRGHPLGAGSMTCARLAATRQLVVSAMERPYDAINQALAAAGVDPRHAVSVPSFATVPYILSGTDMVATVPQKLAERVAEPFQLAQAPSPLGMAALQTNMFWHRRYHQDPGLCWLRELIAEHFSE